MSYAFTVEYLPGVKNSFADALSRQKNISSTLEILSVALDNYKQSLVEERP
jgi:hypothetical protein